MRKLVELHEHVLLCFVDQPARDVARLLDSGHDQLYDRSDPTSGIGSGREESRYDRRSGLRDRGPGEPQPPGSGPRSTAPRGLRSEPGPWSSRPRTGRRVGLRRREDRRRAPLAPRGPPRPAKFSPVWTIPPATSPARPFTRLTREASTLFRLKPSALLSSRLRLSGADFADASAARWACSCPDAVTDAALVWPKCWTSSCRARMAPTSRSRSP